MNGLPAARAGLRARSLALGQVEPGAQDERGDADGEAGMPWIQASAARLGGRIARPGCRIRLTVVSREQHWHPLTREEFRKLRRLQGCRKLPSPAGGGSMRAAQGRDADAERRDRLLLTFSAVAASTG